MNFAGKLMLLSALFVVSVVSYAQNTQGGWFETAAFGKPFVAELHSAQSKLQYSYATVHPELYILDEGEPEMKSYAELHLGTDFDLYSQRKYRQGYMRGFSCKISASTHTLADFFSEISAPVINTDFRLNTSFTYIRYINKGMLRNMSFTVSPLSHESSHIGDEHAVQRTLDSLPIRRINVSYNYGEVNVCINDPDTIKGTLFSFKAGFMYVPYKEDGWYTARWRVEYDPMEFPEKKDLYEYYFQINIQFSCNKSALKNIDRMQVISVELRNRARYGYPLIDGKNDDGTWHMVEYGEEHTWNLSAYLGREYFLSGKYIRSTGFYLRAYYGIDPHGQFRNLPEYKLLGFSFVVKR